MEDMYQNQEVIDTINRNLNNIKMKLSVLYESVYNIVKYKTNNPNITKVSELPEDIYNKQGVIDILPDLSSVIDVPNNKVVMADPDEQSVSLSNTGLAEEYEKVKSLIRTNKN